ncbi:MAG: hypothetical protein U1E50_10785 [Caulobacteraceae bacterium]
MSRKSSVQLAIALTVGVVLAIPAFAGWLHAQTVTGRAERMLAEGPALPAYLAPLAARHRDDCFRLAEASAPAGDPATSVDAFILRQTLGSERCEDFRLAEQRAQKAAREERLGQLTVYRSNYRLLIIDQQAQKGGLFAFGSDVADKTERAVLAARGAPSLLSYRVKSDQARCLMTMEHFAIGLTDRLGRNPATPEWRFAPRGSGTVGIANAKEQLVVSRAISGGVERFTLKLPDEPEEPFTYVAGPHLLALC